MRGAAEIGSTSLACALIRTNCRNLFCRLFGQLLSLPSSPPPSLALTSASTCIPSSTREHNMHILIPSILPFLAAYFNLSGFKDPRSPSRFPGHVLTRLNDGNELPSPFFGVGSVLKFQNVTDDVLMAFSNGYRTIDTASFYQTESSTGTAIAASGIPRENLYITTKFDALYGQNVRHELDHSLKMLGVPYIDLYLIHFPQLSTNLTDTWLQFEKLVDQGLVRSIGVSNFGVDDLNTILSVARIKPTVNQIKYHAYNAANQTALVKLCKENDIVIEAYSSLTPLTTAPGGPAVSVAERIAKRLSKVTGADVTTGQVILTWLRTKGIVAVTTSSKDYRQREQFAPFQDDFPLLTPQEIIDFESFPGWNGTSFDGSLN